MKVVFIQPYYVNIWEALGVGFIASYCRKEYKGSAEFLFFQSYFDPDDIVVEQASRADIVAFSCTSPSYGHGLQLARQIKQLNPRVRIVFGGWHVTALPKCLDDEVIDHIIVGEGEAAFLEIMNGRRDRIVHGRAMSFDELPWPDRKLIRNDRTIDLCESQIGRRITSFQSNRVCPFRCVFCAEKIMTGLMSKTRNPVRSRDPRDVMDEIEVIQRDFGINFFKFVDATFNVSPEFVIAFCEEKIRRNNTMEWECLVHAALATEEMLVALKRANCHQFNVGCESGSAKVLRDMKKGLSPDITARVFDWGRKHGLQRRAFFLIGMPNETEEDLMATEEFIERIDPDVVGVTILCPYPGSDLYDHEKLKHIDWSVTDEYSNDFWETRHFSNAQLKAWQRRITERWQSRLAVRQVMSDAAE